MPELAAMPAQGVQLQNKVQGTLPPIDWSKGKLTLKNYKPFGPNGPAVNVTDHTIGNDKNGNPIIVRLAKAGELTRIEYQYNCHGLSFAGKAGLILDPQSVYNIVTTFYKNIPTSEAKAGDLVVWIGKPQSNMPGAVVHSCVLKTPIYEASGALSFNSIVNTKNGLKPEANMTIAEVDAIYQDPKNGGPCDIAVYTRK